MRIVVAPTITGSSDATTLRKTTSESRNNSGNASSSARARSSWICSETWVNASCPPPAATPGSRSTRSCSCSASASASASVAERGEQVGRAAVPGHDRAGDGGDAGVLRARRLPDRSGPARRTARARPCPATRTARPRSRRCRGPGPTRTRGPRSRRRSPAARRPGRRRRRRRSRTRRPARGRGGGGGRRGARARRTPDQSLWNNSSQAAMTGFSSAIAPRSSAVTMFRCIPVEKKPPHLLRGLPGQPRDLRDHLGVLAPDVVSDLRIGHRDVALHEHQQRVPVGQELVRVRLAHRVEPVGRLGDRLPRPRAGTCR